MIGAHLPVHFLGPRGLDVLGLHSSSRALTCHFGESEKYVIRQDNAPKHDWQVARNKSVETLRQPRGEEEGTDNPPNAARQLVKVVLHGQ
jgi:hypothetical protein